MKNTTTYGNESRHDGGPAENQRVAAPDSSFFIPFLVRAKKSQHELKIKKGETGA